MASETDKRLYEITLPFRGLDGCRLTPSLDFPFDLRIRQDGKDESCYIAAITVTAPTVNQALEEAKDLLNDLLGLFAVKGQKYRIATDKPQSGKRINAPYVSDGPPPPFEVIGGIITELGAELFDPTEDLRRAGRILSFFANPTATNTNVEFEIATLSARHLWDDRLHRAIRQFHRAQCSQDPLIIFLLTYTTLEILSEDEDQKLFSTRFSGKDHGGKTKRNEALEKIRAIFQDLSFNPSETNRFMRSVEDTRASSKLDCFQRYFQKVGINSDRTELEWLTKQRGSFAHGDPVDTSPTAEQRKRTFQNLVAQAITHELSQLHLGSVNK